MAMTANSLSGKIVSELKDAELAAEDDTLLKKMATAIATAVIEEISENAGITIQTGLIQVQGSPSAQANVAPITIPAGSIT